MALRPPSFRNTPCNFPYESRWWSGSRHMWRFQWGYPHSCMVYFMEKSHLEMDDNWGVPLFQEATMCLHLRLWVYLGDAWRIANAHLVFPRNAMLRGNFEALVNFRKTSMGKTTTSPVDFPAKKSSRFPAYVRMFCANLTWGFSSIIPRVPQGPHVAHPKHVPFHQWCPHLCIFMSESKPTTL